MDTPSNYLFVNYANADGVFALRIYTDLTELGHAAWIDQRDMGREENWHQAVNRALQMCSHMLLIWSQDADASSEVESEWAQFIRQDKPILIARRDLHQMHYG
jgi:hypothetical protein